MALLPAGILFPELMDIMMKETLDHFKLYAQTILKSGDMLSPILHMPRGNAKSPMIRGLDRSYGTPIYDELILDSITDDCFNYTVGTPLPLKSLALLDAEDILTRDCMEDDCTWKQGQVAMWCNKYPKKGRKR